ncbi:hypothetical protein K1719_002801 [Acacia pycnantha]|nr:hypothetical protein K1719_002801 [Acacia pycnantha]
MNLDGILVHVGRGMTKKESVSEQYSDLISLFVVSFCFQKLIVLDLSSVHGTWVSGRKIEVGVCVEMKEGDALRIGASSRLYRLHWIPISRAYDLENPFVSESDMAVEAEIGQEDDALPEEEEKEMTQV